VSSRPRKRAIAALLIALAGWFAYATSFDGAFVHDDFPNIVENPYVRRLWPPGPALWANPSLGLHGWPVVAFTFALDHALWGAGPRGFHVTNLALHVLAGIALYAVMSTALRSPAMQERLRARAHGVALAIALLWVVHPLTSSAVTYVVQRCESLMGLFFLLAFHAAQRWLEAPARRWVAVAAIAGVLGAGCKEVIAVLPVVVLAYDMVLHGRTVRSALRSGGALYSALLASSVAVGLLVAWSGGHARSVGVGLDAWTYLKAQSCALIDYLRLAFWPHPLVFDHGSQPAHGLAWLACGSVVMAILALTLLALARRRPIGVAGSVVLPDPRSSFSSVVPIASELAAEHRMYLPLTAVITLVVVAGSLLAQNIGRWVPCVATGGLALVLALATRARNRDYASEERLWSSVLAVESANARAYDALGDVLRRAGRDDEAREHFARAVALQPDAAFRRNNYGSSLSAAGDLDGALEQFRAAVDLAPRFAIARANLGRILYLRGDPQHAVDELRTALLIEPGLAAASRWLGFALADTGRTEKAKVALRAALQVAPDGAQQARRARREVSERYCLLASAASARAKLPASTAMS